jgi:hypothetical protein
MKTRAMRKLPFKPSFAPRLRVVRRALLLFPVLRLFSLPLFCGRASPEDHAWALADAVPRQLNPKQ